MVQQPPSPLVAVVNWNGRMVKLLRLMLALGGYSSVGMEGRTHPAVIAEIVTFLARHDPQVVFFDIPYPYALHWDIFQRVRRTEAAHHRSFVLTSTDPATVQRWAGAADGVAILGLPLDPDHTIRAVEEALRSQSRTDSAHRPAPA
jgi:CheY-like chemotaxis protein